MALNTRNARKLKQRGLAINLLHEKYFGQTQTEAIAKFVPNKGGQEEFFNTVPLDSVYHGQTKYYYLRGGNGSGKSTCGAVFAESRTKLDPEARGLISANDYGQLATSTLVAFAETCQTYGYDLRIGSDKTSPFEDVELTARKIANDHFCFLNGAYIYVLSAKIFEGGTPKASQSGRGLSIRWLWFDEPAYCQHSAFQTIQTRIGRGSGFMPQISLLTGTINKDVPYNWCYELFDDPKRNDKAKEIYQSIKLDTHENAHNLDPEYESVMEASFTQELIEIELRANYAASKTDIIYSYFDRNHHVISGNYLDPRFPIHVSLDFNHHPACAIAATYNPELEELVIIKEWYLKHSDTFLLSEAIATWFLEVRPPIDNFYTMLASQSFELQIHGDATGNQKTANSKKTNWQIVKQTFDDFKIRYRTHYKKANPNVADSINSVNCAFKTDRLWLVEDLLELTRDLESIKRNASGEIDKKSDLMRSHLQDCLRYLVNDILPYDRIYKAFDRNYNKVAPRNFLV